MVDHAQSVMAEGNAPGPDRSGRIDLGASSRPGDYIHIWTQSGAEYWFTRTKDSFANDTHIVGVSMHSDSPSAGNPACHPRDYQMERYITRGEELKFGRTGRRRRPGKTNKVTHVAINGRQLFR